MVTYLLQKGQNRQETCGASSKTGLESYMGVREGRAFSRDFHYQNESFGISLHFKEKMPIEAHPLLVTLVGRGSISTIDM